MKHKLNGEVELSEKEFTDAVLSYVKVNPDLMKQIVSARLKRLGYKVNDVKIFSIGDSFKLKVSIETSLDSVKLAKLAGQPTGSKKKKNPGFWEEFVKLMDSMRQKKTDSITFLKCYQILHKEFKELDFDTFMNYLSDRRQQVKKDFQLNKRRQLIHPFQGEG